MSDIKNENDNIEDVVESEEVLEVALAEENAEENTDETEESTTTMISYEDKDGGLSGLTEKQRRRKEIWDKITTGILIFLMCSPLIIVTYILLWFFLK